MADTSDWVEKFDEKKQRPYWRNKKTKEASLKNPFLDSGTEIAKQGEETTEAVAEQDSADQMQDEVQSLDKWIKKFDGKKARQYWEHRESGEIRWKDPSSDENDHQSGADPLLAASIASAALGKSVSDFTSIVI